MLDVAHHMHALLCTLGGVFIALRIVHTAIKIVVVRAISGDSTGGGGVPTFDGVIFPPIFIVFGVFLVTPSSLTQRLGWTGYLLGRLALTGLLAFIHYRFDR